MNSGSNQAIKNSCTCAELDNSGGGEFYWVESDCPLHGNPTKQTPYGDLCNGDFEYLINPHGVRVEDELEKDHAHVES